MSMRINWLILFMCIPLMAQAQAYKCKQPNGTLSFQDHPCLAGSVSSKITLLPVTSEPVEPANQFRAPKETAMQKTISPQEAWQAKERDNQRQQAEEKTRAQNQNASAYNRMRRCDFARRQLGILKESRPAYRHDNKGDRQYIKDENRQAETSAAQKSVAEECR